VKSLDETEPVLPEDAPVATTPLNIGQNVQARPGIIE